MSHRMFGFCHAAVNLNMTTLALLTALLTLIANILGMLAALWIAWRVLRQLFR